MQREAINIEVALGHEKDVAKVATSAWEKIMSFGKVFDIEQAFLLNIFFEQCGVNTQKTLIAPEPKKVKVTYENLHYKGPKAVMIFTLLSTDIYTIAQAIKQTGLNINGFLNNYVFLLSENSSNTGKWVSSKDKNYIAFIFSFDVLD